MHCYQLHEHTRFYLQAYANAKLPYKPCTNADGSTENYYSEISPFVQVEMKWETKSKMNRRKKMEMCKCFDGNL